MMREVILYTAVSLDMFMAREDGAIDWLYTDRDYGYHEFYESINTTIMGYNTYRQIKSFGPPFPYSGKTNYVFSRHHQQEEGYVQFIAHKVIPFVKDLKKERGKDIWLIGGAEINDILLEAGLIDKMVLSVHPIFLGKGIPLFPHTQLEVHWELVESHIYEKGLVQLRYKRKVLKSL